MQSSAAEVTSESGPVLGQESTPPEHPAGGGFRSKRRILVVALVVGMVLFVGLRVKTPSINNAALHSSAPADLSRTLRLKGATEAVQTRAVLAPLLAGQQVGTLTITKLTLGGSHVKRGDLLVEFDRQAQIRDSLDKQAEFDKLNGQVLEELAKEDAARAKDETEIKQAEDNLSKAELEMQKVETLSRIDAEKAHATLDETKATLQQLRETFDLKRSAAQAAIRILEIQRDRTHETMLHAKANAG